MTPQRDHVLCATSKAHSCLSEPAAYTAPLCQHPEKVPPNFVPGSCANSSNTHVSTSTQPKRCPVPSWYEYSMKYTCLVPSNTGVWLVESNGTRFFLQVVVPCVASLSCVTNTSRPQLASYKVLTVMCLASSNTAPLDNASLCPVAMPVVLLFVWQSSEQTCHAADARCSLVCALSVVSNFVCVCLRVVCVCSSALMANWNSSRSVNSPNPLSCFTSSALVWGPHALPTISRCVSLPSSSLRACTSLVRTANSWCTSTNCVMSRNTAGRPI